MKISINSNTNKENPATYKQLQYFKDLGGIVNVASSQVTKKLDKSVMATAIDAQKNGEKVEINFYDN